MDQQQIFIMINSGGVWLLFATIMTIAAMIYRRNRFDVGYSIFTIRKNKHYSHKDDAITTLKFALAPTILRFKAIFCEGCDYDSIKIGDSINKLYGISFGFDNHWRSVIIGWRYNSNLKVIELFSYAYIEGKRYINKLINVKQFEEVFFTIAYDENSKEVTVLANEDELNMSAHTIPGVIKSWVKFINWPYFGGKTAAPHDMKIIIK